MKFREESIFDHPGVPKLVLGQIFKNSAGHIMMLADVLMVNPRPGRAQRQLWKGASSIYKWLNENEAA